MLKRILLGAAACLLLSMPSLAREQQAPKIDVSDYQRAEAMLNANIRPKLLNASVDPIWLPGGDHFWYKHQSASGWDYVAVDPAHAQKAPAFDHAALAKAITGAGGKGVDAAHLPLDDLAFVGGSPTRIAFTAAGLRFTCDLAPVACTSAKALPLDPHSLMSPDGRLAVFAKNDNLWLRDVATGKEHALTKDGVPHFSYGKMPDSSLLRVISQTKGFQLPLYGVDWSPDSRHLVAQREDERKVPDYYFLQMVPYNGDRRPQPVTVRSPLSGETGLVSSDVAVIDVKTGASRHLLLDGKGLSNTHYWDPNGSRFLAMQGGDYSREETLFEVKIADGSVRPIIHEASKTFLQVSPLEYDEPALRFLPASNEVIWYSQRDGWNHLYLVDAATGAIKAKITNGDWDIQNIIRVDEKARRVYFTAAGREAGENPYWRHLYSAGFDGSDLKLLTPAVGDHNFPGRINPEIAMTVRGLVPNITVDLIAPSGNYLIDTVSTLQKPPVSTLMRLDGSVVMPLETADASAAYAAGWVAPEPFTAKAADGKTDLYGMIIKPHDFDPHHTYPVIDAIYNGPQIVTTPHDFVNGMSGLFMGDAQAFAQLGFVVVVMDSRGTPMRSKAFQDYIYNNMQEFGLEDHVAVIKALATTRPFMDIDRVGIYGHSFGGFTSMKGMLGYPDFFKVGASSAGPYDLYGMYSLDAFFAPPLYKNGTSTPVGPGDAPTNWGAFDLTQQAGNLKGKLLLAFADLDENCYPAEAARMINALVAANKSFDLIYLPNRSHAFAGEPYFVRRRWDFFVKNLLGAEPPADYRMSQAP